MGAPDDAYEQEADAVADRVMPMAGGPGGIRVAQPRHAEPSVSLSARDAIAPRRAAPLQGAVPEKVASNIDALRSGGTPLSYNERNFFEPLFGADFGALRVHTGPQAARTAAAINARAFTVGNEIVFGADQYAPGTHAGRRLLAHELTHTLQNARATNQKTVRRSPIVTEGSFGQALGKFTEIHFEDQEKRLEEKLNGSSTFMQMAERLDAQVSLPGSPIFDVRRSIKFVGATAPNFLPREAPENTSLIDYLYVLWPFETFGIARALTEEELNSIADSIVHETKHLYEYVNGPGHSAPASAMEAIASGVSEERSTRRTEARAQQEMIDAGVRTPASAPTTDPQRIAALESSQSPALIERSLTGIHGLTTYLEAFTLSYLQGKEAGEMESSRIRLAQDLALKLSNILPMGLDDSLEHWSAYTLYSSVFLATTEHLEEGLDENFIEYMTQVLVGLLFTKRWREFSNKTSTIGLSLDEYIKTKEAILIGHAALLSERASVRYRSL